MTSTADCHREAGMPPPLGEAYIPLGPNPRAEAILRAATTPLDTPDADTTEEQS